MMYQERKSIPYNAQVGRIREFQSHRHPDIEILSCICGEIKINVDESEYMLRAGETIFIRSMAAHETFHTDEDSEFLLIDIGPVFSPQYFSQIERLKPVDPIITSEDARPYSDKLYEVFGDIIHQCRNKRPTSELVIIGDLYRVCAYLIELFGNEQEAHTKVEYSRAYYAIEKAIETVHAHYNEPITVDQIADATGYSKSSFCSLFKTSVGTSFHSYLNEFRIKNACYLLTNTDLPISEIAETVGFADVKTFYRAFNRVMGTTPGNVREKRE